MKVKDLRDGMKRIDVRGTIDLVDPARTVNLKAGGNSDVAEAILRDEEGGQVCLTLWNEQIEQVKAGSVVDVLNGYTSSFNGTLRLNVGRFGRLVVLAE